MFDFLATERWSDLPAVLPITGYDTAIMHRLEQVLDHDDKECLASWTLLANSSHQTRLLTIKPKVEAIQPPPKEPLALYRGFGSAPGFQDMMGFAVPTTLGSKLAPGVRVGSTKPYINKRPLSLTSAKEIAEAFGPYVVETQLDPAEDAALILTDELCVVIQRFTRQSHFLTQREVILLTTGIARDYRLVKAP